ncbi:MAG TPA: hypothetical protein VMM60_12070 [Ilumatobacter sp.]|nr:hypothetical protein [Ilumatobacter sp.]
MSNTKRPSTTRKVTRKTEEKRDEALSQGVSIAYDGKVYTVRAGDLTGLDSAALRRECGYSFAGLLKALTKDPDIDLIAALVWLSRRTDGEKLLSYDEVAAEIGYDSDIEVVDTEPEDESPEG